VPFGIFKENQRIQVEEDLPFRLLGLDFDNGGEWLDWHLIRYLQERAHRCV
jgi:hypothetical protein